MSRFLRRHNLSLRCTTTKNKKNDDQAEEIQKGFLSCIKNLIATYQIHSKYIINIDESPIYWEYLPRKIIYKKGAKVVPSLKTGFEYKRSTLTLACTAWGDMLRPALILKRNTPYKLECDNEIDLLLQFSPNGWTTTNTFCDWIKQILIPYVKENPCLLLMDSYEAHICMEVRKVIKGYPNICTVVIPGGYTDTFQPLDLGINSFFKRYCKEMALEFANKAIEDMVKDNQHSIEKQKLKLVFLSGKYLSYYNPNIRRK